jgi:hypothetical protein
MYKYFIPLFVVFLSRSILCDCIPIFPYKSYTLDTLTSGVVKVTKCYYELWTNYGSVKDTCVIDTSYEQKLLNSLRSQYMNKKSMIIGYVDSVIAIHDTFWIEDAVHESLSVAIDTVLKGSLAAKSRWFIFFDGCKNGYGSILKKPFISFLNDFDSLSRLGIDPGFLDGNPNGFFLAGNKIYTPSMPGVSVDLMAFLDAMSAGVRNTTRNPVNTLSTGFLTLSKLCKLVQQKNLQELQFFTADGRLVFSSGNAQEQMKFLNSLKTNRGIYFVKLMGGTSTITARLLFAR